MNADQELKSLKHHFQLLSEKLDRLIDLGQNVEDRLIALETRSNENATSTIDSDGGSLDHSPTV